MIRLPVLLTLLALVAAGCISATPEAEDDLAPAAKSLEEILPYLDVGDEHNHFDASQHRGGWNLDIVGHNKLADSWEEVGRYNQVQVRGTLAYVSVYEVPGTGSAGLMIVDFSDPADPVIVGSVTTPDTTPIDVYLTSDGRHALLASHRTNLPVDIPPTCTGTPVINACVPFVPWGVTVVNVEDAAEPRVVHMYRSWPSGAHTVKYLDIGGDGYVFIASYGFTNLNRLVPSVEITRFVDEPNGGARLEFVSRYVLDDPAYLTDGSVFVHDMWIEEHPATGDVLMYVSHWDAGVRIVDVSNPATPREIAAWNDFDRAVYGNIHFARPYPTLIEGRHVTFAAPEYGSAEHSGKLWVLDTTDPAQPKTLGEWTIPGDPVSECCYRYSPHNFDLRDGLLLYGHYHAGVWVLDVSTPEKWSYPQVIGFRFPVPEEDVVFEEDAPNVWNAVWTDDGLIVASDITSGLYVLRLGEREPGVPPYEHLL